MKNKHRLIIDASSILRASHFAGKDIEFGRQVTFEDKKVFVNSAGWGYENFMVSYKALLELMDTKPFQTIFVKDGADSRQLRRLLYAEYKGKRVPFAPEINEEYNALVEGIEDEILAMGGTSMIQDGMEADDVIAYLAKNLDGRKTIWSRDGDMLALHNDQVDVYLKDTMNPDIYKSCPAPYVLLYKALVGDSSDNLPGAKGFGEKTFTKMVLAFGYEGCDEFMKLLENRELGKLEEDVADFKPLQKVLDNQQAVYASYSCAKFYDHRINTSRDPLQIQTGMCQQWDPKVRHRSLREYFGTKTLITRDNYADEFARLLPLIKQSPYISLDVEASDTDEGEAWAKAIDDSKKGRKTNTVDAFGQVLTGMSITYGSNLQHTLYCPVDHIDTNNCSIEQAKALVDAIPQDLIKAVHNSNYELPKLYQTWGEWLSNVWDTIDLKSHVDENTRHGLKPCAKQFFGYDQQTYTETTTKEGPKGTLQGGTLVKLFEKELEPAVKEIVMGPDGQPVIGVKNLPKLKVIKKAVTATWEQRKYRMNQLSAQHVFDYACDDTIVTAALLNRCLLTMELEKTLQAFLDCDVEASYWVAQSYVDGVNLNLDRLKEISDEDDLKFDEAWQKLKPYLFEIEWPGTKFIPYPDVKPASVKAGFLAIHGEKLNTLVRMPEKLAAFLEDKDETEMARCVLENDLEGFNTYMESFFTPYPNFSVNKKEQLRTLLYDVLELPVRFRTRLTDNQRAKGQMEGTPQADFAAVEHALKLDLEEGSPIKDVLIWVRTMTQVETRRKLYYRPFPLLVHWSDGKLHANLGKNMAATRRFTPNNPNLNQLAKKGEGKKVRSTIEAPEGYVVVAMDFSGQELRLAAEESQDEMLLSCYIGDNLRDPHSLTGASIAKDDGSEFGDYELFEEARHGEDEDLKIIIDDFRGKGKNTNFSSQYLCRAAKLGKLLVVEEDEAQKFLDAKNAVYFGLAQWQQDTIVEAHAQGYVTTRLGARRHLHHKLSSFDKWLSQEAERQCVNFKIQGSGAEMTKRAINAMRPILPRYGAKFWMPVHDEGVMIIPIKNLVPALKELHACMVQSYGNMTVPLESEISIGRNFGELVEVGTEPDAELIRAALAKL